MLIQKAEKGNMLMGPFVNAGHVQSKCVIMRCSRFVSNSELAHTPSLGDTFPQGEETCLKARPVDDEVLPGGKRLKIFHRFASISVSLLTLECLHGSMRVR